MHIEGCKHEIEVTVPTEEIERETDRVITDLQKKVRLPGFRPGKAPASIIKSRFAAEVRHDVLDHLIPKYFQEKATQEELSVVGVPNIKEVHFEPGEPLRFTAEFEVAPVIELKDHRGIQIQYHEPEVTEAEIDERLNQLRDQKAQYVDIDPRPAEAGDHALVSLESLSGMEPPIRQDEMSLLVGDTEKLPEFTEALMGMTPEQEKDFSVTYPAEYEQADLAGKTVQFRMKLRMLRRKEPPELNDEFAKDLGDFQTLDQLRETLRKTIFREKEFAAQQTAKEELITKLVEAHDFPVPEAYIERQAEAEAEAHFRQATGKEIDFRRVKENIDWGAFKERLRPKITHDVKATLLIEKVADAENIHTTQDEVDREVQRIARQEREPAAAVRKKLEKAGILGRIAHRIRTEKTVNLLFEHARKEA